MKTNCSRSGLLAWAAGGGTVGKVSNGVLFNHAPANVVGG
jgi:hypothetical protein